MPSDLPVIYSGIAISLVGGCSAVAGFLARVKRRSPLEGVLLGLFLGPIGVLIESRNPHTRRPEVDKHAWDSLRLMMTHQQSYRESGRLEAPDE
jgi:hypothetical protein